MNSMAVRVPTSSAVTTSRAKLVAAPRVSTRRMLTIRASSKGERGADKIQDGAGDLWESGKQAVDKTLRKGQDNLESFGDDVKGAARDVKHDVKSSASDVKHEAKHQSHRAEDSGRDLRDRAEDTGRDLRGKAEDTGRDLRDRADETGEEAERKAKSLKQRAGHTLDKVVDKVEDGANATGKFVADRVEDTAGAIKDGAKNVEKHAAREHRDRD